MEKQGYSGVERFLFMMVPILFVIALLFVLLTLFDMDFRNRALSFGQEVPILRDVLPEPKVAGNTMDDDQIRSIKLKEKIDELETELAAAQNELAQATADKEQNGQTVEQLQQENETLKQENEEKLLTDEQYAAKINDLAGMFTDMTPSKAAPIIQSMSLDEMVLLFSTMRGDDRGKIMEKMDPKIAAEATMKLKDNESAKDLQIAALQDEIIAAQADAAASQASTLDDSQLSATFAAMDAKSAAQLLLKMTGISSTKVLRILNSVNNATRSGLLSEMSNIDQNATASIMAKLMEGS